MSSSSVSVPQFPLVAKPEEQEQFLEEADRRLNANPVLRKRFGGSLKDLHFMVVKWTPENNPERAFLALYPLRSRSQFCAMMHSLGSSIGPPEDPLGEALGQEMSKLLVLSHPEHRASIVRYHTPESPAPAMVQTPLIGQKEEEPAPSAKKEDDKEKERILKERRERLEFLRARWGVFTFRETGLNEADYLQRVAKVWDTQEMDWVVIRWKNPKGDAFLQFYGASPEDEQGAAVLAGFLRGLNIPARARYHGKKEVTYSRVGVQEAIKAKKKNKGFFPQLVAYQSETLEDLRAPLEEVFENVAGSVDDLLVRWVPETTGHKEFLRLDHDAHKNLGPDAARTDYAVVRAHEEDGPLTEELLLAISAVFGDKLVGCLRALGIHTRALNEESEAFRQGSAVGDIIKSEHPNVVLYSLAEFASRPISSVQAFPYVGSEEDTYLLEIREEYEQQAQGSVRSNVIPPGWGNTFDETDYVLVKWELAAKADARKVKPYLSLYGCDRDYYDQLRGFVARLQNKPIPDHRNEAVKMGYIRGFEERWRYDPTLVPTVLVEVHREKRKVVNIGLRGDPKTMRTPPEVIRQVREYGPNDFAVVVQWKHNTLPAMHDVVITYKFGQEADLVAFIRCLNGKPELDKPEHKQWTDQASCEIVRMIDYTPIVWYPIAQEQRLPAELLLDILDEPPIPEESDDESEEEGGEEGEEEENEPPEASRSDVADAIELSSLSPYYRLATLVEQFPKLSEWNRLGNPREIPPVFQMKPNVYPHYEIAFYRNAGKRALAYQVYYIARRNEPSEHRIWRISWLGVPPGLISNKVGIPLTPIGEGERDGYYVFDGPPVNEAEQKHGNLMNEYLHQGQLWEFIRTNDRGAENPDQFAVPAFYRGVKAELPAFTVAEMNSADFNPLNNPKGTAEEYWSEYEYIEGVTITEVLNLCYNMAESNPEYRRPGRVKPDMTILDKEAIQAKRRVVDQEERRQQNDDPFDEDIIFFRNEQFVSLAELAHIVYDLVELLGFLRRARVVHGDLHSDNLIMGNHRIRLIDFETARYLGPQEGDMKMPGGVEPQSQVTTEEASMLAQDSDGWAQLAKERGMQPAKGSYDYEEDLDDVIRIIFWFLDLDIESEVGNLREVDTSGQFVVLEQLHNTYLPTLLDSLYDIRELTDRWDKIGEIQADDFPDFDESEYVFPTVLEPKKLSKFSRYKLYKHWLKIVISILLVESDPLREIRDRKLMEVLKNIPPPPEPVPPIFREDTQKEVFEEKPKPEPMQIGAPMEVDDLEPFAPGSDDDPYDTSDKFSAVVEKLRASGKGNYMLVVSWVGQAQGDVYYQGFEFNEADSVEAFEEGMKRWDEEKVPKEYRGEQAEAFKQGQEAVRSDPDRGSYVAWKKKRNTS